MRRELINSHLDTCIARAPAQQPARPRAPLAPAPMFTRGGARSGGGAGGRGTVEPPPKLLFHLLKDKELKAKLQQHQLPVDGKRPVRLLTPVSHWLGGW